MNREIKNKVSDLKSSLNSTNANQKKNSSQGVLSNKSTIGKIFFIYSHSDKEICEKAISNLPIFMEELKSFISNKIPLRTVSSSRKKDADLISKSYDDSNTFKVSELISKFDKISNGVKNRKEIDKLEIKKDIKIHTKIKENLFAKNALVKDLINQF